MSSDPLDRPATPARLHALVEGGALPPAALGRALELAHRSPPTAQWMASSQLLALALGAALVLAGVIYFFAFNWAELGRFVRLGVLQACVAGAATGAWAFGERPAGRVLLIAAAVLVGPLLAVYGQAYQTGADAWELFLGWSLLILPWVVLARSETLWLLFLVLGNVGALLFSQQVLEVRLEGTWMLPVLGAVNAAAWGSRERLAATRRGADSRWFARLAFCGALALPLPLAMGLLAGMEVTFATITSLGLVVGVAGVAFARFRGPGGDLFLVAWAAVVPCILGTVLLGRMVLEVDPIFGSLVLAVAVLVQLTVLGRWLRRAS